jgi:molybdopterin molybdotransferase
MISLAEARSIVAANVGPVPAEPGALEVCQDRVLREAVLAPDDIPGFDRSAMDGYAVADNAIGTRLRVAGEISAGLAPGQTFGAGECLRIFTGAAVPVAATHVVPQEWVARTGDEILIEKNGPQNFIRRRGEDAKAGDVLLQAGTVLGPGSCRCSRRSAVPPCPFRGRFEWRT